METFRAKILVLQTKFVLLRDAIQLTSKFRTTVTLGVRIVEMEADPNISDINLYMLQDPT